MWLNIGVALLVLFIASLATFAVLRNKNAVNRTFAVFSYTTALWIVANFIGANYKDHIYARYFIHADFALGAIVALTFWYFTATLLAQADAPAWLATLRNKFRVVLTLLVGVTSLASLSTWTVAVVPKAGGGLVIDYNGGYVFYTLVLGFLLLAGCILLGLTLKYASGVFRGQVLTISRGLVVGVVFVAAANLILPQLTNASSINLTAGNLSYFGFIAFIASTAYAVIYHRLFDLRLFVVRAAAYAFTVSLVTIFYLAPAIWVISRVVKVHLTGYELLGLIAISLVLTIVYRYLRRLFDQITNRVFFRNFYDTQDVLDKLSELLVRTIDVTQIEEGSKKILLGALHATSLGYWLNEGADKTVTETLQALFKRGDNLVVLDEHEGVANKLAELLKEDVALVVRLRTTHGELGYMTIGFKASGQMYSTQDKRLLSTAADEIAISMQNALHFAEIQNFNLTLQERVQKATLELRKTNEKLKALDETKDEFITMASHQLRTPLTSVKGYLSMVLEGDAGKLNAQQEQLLRQSYASSQRMVFLISDLLNLSRLNTGKFVFEPMPVYLPGVVKS